MLTGMDVTLKQLPNGPSIPLRDINFRIGRIDPITGMGSLLLEGTGTPVADLGPADTMAIVA